MGRIEQVSRPVDLYTRPQTPFVARFIGRNTLVAGKLADAGGLIETPYGPMRGVVADRLLRTGDAAQIVLPSEALEPHRDGTDQADLQAQYQGNPALGTGCRGRSGCAHAADPRRRFRMGGKFCSMAMWDMAAARGWCRGHPLLIGLRPEEATIVAADQA